jgi:nucleotide-binding universal stress UspA family protein
MLDPHVAMSVVALPVAEETAANGESWVQQDVKRAEQLRREMDIQVLPKGDPAEAVVQLAESGGYDVIIIGQASPYEAPPLNVEYVMRHAPCWVCVVTPSAIPREVDEEKPSKTG